MKSTLIIAILCFTAFCDFVEEDDVLVVTKDNFDELLEKYQYVMIEFYAPWCGHCKKFAPDYSKAAAQLKSMSNVAVAKVDATVEEDLAKQFQIQGFPTIKFISKALGVDKALSYEGARTAEDVVSYIQKKSGPASDSLDTLDELKSFVQKSENNQVVFVYFGDDEGEDFEVFKQVAMTQEKVLFGHVEVAEARTEYKVPDGVKAVLFKGFEEKRNDFTGKFELKELNGFVNANQLPSLIPFNDKAIQAIFQQGNRGIFLFCNESEESLTALENFAVVAKEFKDQVKFTFSKPNDESGLFSRLAEYVGASTNELPNIMIIDPQNENSKYKYEQKDMSVENLKKFLQDFVAGKVDRYMKSEDIPENNDEPVKVLVGKQFKELVVENDKDVLVEFYAPWCGHCKQLAPIYEEVAKSLAGNSKIMIAKCDATANEVQGVDIQSFPTLKFWKNGQKDTPIAFSGDRTHEGILQFLKENASHSWVEVETKSDL